MYDNAKPAFNAVQRGHQNMLETHYAMLWLMTLGGLKHPLGSAIAGAVYSVGRIVYAYGYESGDVKKRVYGSLFFYPAYFTAVGFTVSLMGTLLGYW
jgi:glutathione S-transferase